MPNLILVYRGEEMAYIVKKFGDHRERRSYSKSKNAIELSNLLEIQKKSYEWFMTDGIKEVFDDIFPVESFTGNLSLSFGDYFFESPRYSIKGCKDRYATYAQPLKVQAQLFNHETGEVKEQEIYLGDMPIMTDGGTFIINGAERVIVSQLVRSPSVYFGKTIDKNGRLVITSQIIPTRGTWLEFETDARDVIYVRIDRTRKVPITTLLRAIGLSSDEDIIDLFGENEYLIKTIEKDANKNTDEALIDIHSKLRPGEPSTLDSAKNQLITRFFDSFRYDLAKVGRYKFNKKLNVLDRLLDCKLAEDIKVNGEVVFAKDTVITKDIVEQLKLKGRLIGEVVLYNPDFRGGFEQGCRIAPEYAGHGYGAEAFAAAADWALYHLGLARVVAKCFKENEPSRKMLSACMRPSGEDDTYFYFEKTV